MPDIGTIRPHLTEMTEAIRALIVLPLIYAMLTQLRVGAEPPSYTFLEALRNGLIATLALLAGWWLIRRHQLVNQNGCKSRGL